MANPQTLNPEAGETGPAALQISGRHLPQSLLGEATDYTLGQWTKELRQWATTKMWKTPFTRQNAIA
ncbi:MAG: hypothetical protein AB1813_22360 [Verrucomicrobiota bacterium]